MKTLALQGSLSVAARMVTFFCNMTILSLLSRALDPQTFGYWTLILHLVLMLSLLNIFVGGDGLRNALVASQDARELFFSVFYIAMPICGMVALGSLSLGYSVVALVVLRLPFQLQVSGFLATARAQIHMILEAFEALLVLGAIYYGMAIDLSALHLMHWAFGVSLAATMVTFCYFLILQEWVPKRTALKAGLTAIRTFIPYLLQRLFLLSSVALPPLLVFHLLGPKAAGEFHLLYRLFFSMYGLYVVFFTPLWADYPRAVQQNDAVRLRKNFRRATKWTLLLFCAGGLLITMVHGPVLSILTGKKLVNYPLALWFFCLMLLQGIIAHFSMFLVGLSRVKKQLIAMAIGIGIQVLTSYFLYKGFQSAGILVGSVMGAVFMVQSCRKEVMRCAF